MRRGGENSKMSFKRRFASVFSVFFLFLEYQYSKNLIFNKISVILKQSLNRFLYI